MSHKGWKNLRTDEDLRALEKHYREVGYSDGYALLPAKSTNIEYQRGWSRGYAARRSFEGGCEA